MKYAAQEATDKLANELFKKRNRAKRSDDQKIKQDFDRFQNYCIERFSYLVISRIARYRKFENYEDLYQDGLEALVLALRTFRPSKGSFCWWAEKYINTRVSRAANTHSTVRVPLKIAKSLKPHKVLNMPIMIDSRLDAIESIARSEESEKIKKAIRALPIEHQQVVNVVYGFEGHRPGSIRDAVRKLEITRSSCLKILDEAKMQLKDQLIE